MTRIKILAVVLLTSGFGLTGCGSSPEASNSDPVLEVSSISESWVTETRTDDFGDKSTLLTASVINGDGELYELVLRCQEKSLQHGIVGSKDDGYLFTWATYDASVRLDGGEVLKWPVSDVGPNQLLVFEMGTPQFISKLTGRKTLSIKVLPGYVGGDEHTHIFTMPIDGLESKLDILTKAGCKI